MNSEQRFKIGWICGMLSGGMPILIGLRMQVLYVLPAMQEEQITYEQMLEHLTGNLLITLALSGMAVVYFGLRKRQAWAWWVALLMVICAMGDLFAVVRMFGLSPFLPPLVPVSFGVACVLLTAPEIFGTDQEASTP